MDEREKRAAFCGGKAALVLLFDRYQKENETLKKGGAGNPLKDYRQIMKKILSKCKQQQQLHLTFISISPKYEESLARL